jgi:hypothetical protein
MRVAIPQCATLPPLRLVIPPHNPDLLPIQETTANEEISVVSEELKSEETALSAFKHWLSLLSEDAIPPGFREILS